jgi:hypothetical protein
LVTALRCSWCRSDVPRLIGLFQSPMSRSTRNSA